MKIMIPGGSGQVGTLLARAFYRDGHRTETELILKSRRVRPGRLLADGFSFSHPAWPQAARELCARWRARSRGR